MDPIVLVVFLVVYLGMVLGRLPGWRSTAPEWRRWARSAVFANDVVCLAMTPVLAVGCLRRGLRPEPFLLALACAANVGSAATLIGNPQNMLIGQRLGLSFSGYLADGLVPAASAGVDLGRPAWLFPLAAVLSNLVSNVPAVMPLLPAATHQDAGAVLALSSTLAGNLLLVGSIANLIVAEHAGRLGIRIGWRQHARVGVPVTAATPAIAAGLLAVRGLLAAG